MADLNKFLISGVIPRFENPIISGNLEDSERAWARISISVMGTQKQENGYYKEEILTVTAFRKTAQLAKHLTPGTGIIVEGRIGPSQPIVKDGNNVLTQDGKRVYSGMNLVATSISFMRGVGKPQQTQQKETKQEEAKQEMSFMDELPF